MFFPADCRGIRIATTSTPPEIRTDASGLYSVVFVAHGFSDFDACLRVAVRRTAADTGVKIERKPVSFRDQRKGQPVESIINVSIP